MMAEKMVHRNAFNHLRRIVVNSEVALQGGHDFSLESQLVRQSTIIPTNQNIIGDTSRLKPKHLQILMYKLTHLYYVEYFKYHLLFFKFEN